MKSRKEKLLDLHDEKNETSFQVTSRTKGFTNRIQIAVFGSGKVGKTSIIKQYLFANFQEKYLETIEDIYKKVVSSNSQNVDLTVVDTAGNYQFPAMRELAIKQSDGFILVYSIDSISSFQEAARLRGIIKAVKDMENIPIILVGNKTDTGRRRIERVEASLPMRNWGSRVQHIETSAKLDYNIKLLFNSLIAMIDEQRNEKLENHGFKDISRHRLSSMRASVVNKTKRASRSLSFARKNERKQKNHLKPP